MFADLYTYINTFHIEMDRVCRMNGFTHLKHSALINGIIYCSKEYLLGRVNRRYISEIFLEGIQHSITSIDTDRLK